MKRILSTFGLAMALAVAGAAPSHAADCEVTNFEVQSYEDGTTFVYGIVGGNYRHILLCTGSGGTNTCDTRGTDRNVSIASTALASGRPLWFYIATPATCDAVATHARPGVWILK